MTLTLKPAPADAGIRFRRSDLGIDIPANVAHLRGTNHATGLSRNGASVDTVEHLLAAIVSLGIDNVTVELGRGEVPVMD
ncbi:MAG: UDP-3-O-acyl-N-acetylglucosamine deacetylase, partial [Actinomycetes bacterium]